MRYVNCGTDNIWIDCAQLENGAAMSAYNLVQNGGFEDTSSTVWEAINCTTDDKYYTGGTYGRHFYMKGEGSKDKRLIQKIYINRSASKVFLSISGYAKAESVPIGNSETRKFAISVGFHFTDGSDSSYQYISFNPDYTAGWQYASGTVGVKDPGNKTVDYVYLRCCYYQNANGANFDRIKVNIDECGTSYTYDNDGNLISAKDNAGHNESYSYNSDNELENFVTADNKEFNFDYDTVKKHRLVNAASVSSGIKNSFDYDASGNTTKIRIDKSGYDKYIEQYTTYTTDGNYLSKSYSDRGYATTYDYDTYKGTLKSVTDANGKVTSYEYDANTDYVTKATADDSSVTYSYNNKGQLTSIKSPGDSPAYNFVYDKWGNNTVIKVGTQVLVTNTYKPNNGAIETQTYGNNAVIKYNFDNLDREISRVYNNNKRFYWTYGADGNLSRYSEWLYDPVAQQETFLRSLNYLYDGMGRLLQVNDSDGSYIKTSYGETYLPSSLHYKFNGQRRDVYFHYSDKDNLPLDVKFGTGSAYAVSNLYDGLTRVYEKDYTLVGNTSNSELKAEYSYVDWSSTPDRTTGTVRGINYTFADGGLKTHDRWYTYDKAGNILTENRWISSTSKPVQESYTYDAKNQLVRHDSVTQNCTITYSYDAGGNITAKKTYAYTTGSLDNVAATNTVNYTYGNSAWKDELTAYNGETISYDAIGNPTTYRGWAMAWYGRQLESASKDGTNLSFGYNADGIRLSKTMGSTTTQYLLNGTQILAQKTGSTILSFFYDQQGNRVGMADGSNNFYYYLYNIQGDVVALADASTGKLAATYTYDAWGKCTVTNASGYTIGTQNPFRYRGYYYDTETGLYYLNSRYYDPEVGRFINADATEILEENQDHVLQHNLFAYCLNNPVNMSDQNGDIAANIVGAIAGGLTGAALGYYLAKKLGLTGRKRAALIAAATVGGAALGAFLGPYIAKLGSKIAALTTRTAKIGTSFGKIGKLVKYRKITANWEKTTSYAFRRMAERGMSKSMVEGILKNGKVLQQSANKFVYITKKGVVVVEATGKIVTAYSNKYFDSAMRAIVKQLFG